MKRRRFSKVCADFLRIGVVESFGREVKKQQLVVLFCVRDEGSFVIPRHVGDWFWAEESRRRHWSKRLLRGRDGWQMVFLAAVLRGEEGWV